MTTRVARRRVLAAAGLVVAVSGCAGTGAGGDGSAAVTSATAATSARQVDPPRFADVVADAGTFVVDVHTPDEGSIAGTDAAIPFDQLGQRAQELPQDTATTVAVYCRTGRMSAVAVATLADLGYTDVVELRGGMEAWQRDGRDLLTPGAGPTG